MRLIYKSSTDGDRWFLGYDGDNTRVFVRHEPNVSSGGNVGELEIGEFLTSPGNGPEKTELLALISTLV
jgi:hypothetical protein